MTSGRPKRKTPRRPADQIWAQFANRDSLQDMHDLKQAQTVPSPDLMQGAVDALERAWAGKKQKTSEHAAAAAIEKARASARRNTKRR